MLCCVVVCFCCDKGCCGVVIGIVLIFVGILWCGVLCCGSCGCGAVCCGSCGCVLFHLQPGLRIAAIMEASSWAV